MLMISFQLEFIKKKMEYASKQELTKTVREISSQYRFLLPDIGSVVYEGGKTTKKRNKTKSKTKSSKKQKTTSRRTRKRYNKIK